MLGKGKGKRGKDKERGRCTVWGGGTKEVKVGGNGERRVGGEGVVIFTFEFVACLRVGKVGGERGGTQKGRVRLGKGRLLPYL